MKWNGTPSRGLSLCKITWVGSVPTGDEYRAKAAEFLAIAEAQTDARALAAYQTLAQSYLRLAEQSERNAHADIVYEPPTPEPAGEPIVLSPAPFPTVASAEEPPPLAASEDPPDNGTT